ncbi:MAG: SdrD B-like domain-containing protein, partial [Actinomycetota bacterium]
VADRRRGDETEVAVAVDRDPGEPGLVGVDVRLDDGAGSIVTVTTVAGGAYEFVGVAPDSYTVSVDVATLPTGAVATTTGAPVPVTVASDELIDDVDLGYVLPASLSGRVWADADGGGTQNGESAMPGVDVELLDAGGNVVAADTTAADGSFSFPGLLPGAYSVRPVMPAGMVLTTPDVGGDDTVDSDVLPATGETAAVVLVSGSTVTDVDAGLFELATIGDTVFADLDGNGVQGIGEPGIAGVTVTVRDAGGMVVGTDVTGGDGTYGVTVDPGTLSVTVTVPAGWSAGSAGDTQAAIVTSGTDIDDVDFPLTGALELAGSVVYDVAGDATNDTSDPGLGGITMTATWDGPDGPVVFTTTTQPDGSYLFGDLPPGSYDVVVDDTTLPNGIIQPTIDPDGPAGGVDLATTISLTGASLTALDFGVTGTARLGDNVFVDADGDGVLDAGESGVGGVTVTATVTTTAGVITLTTVTDPTGFYEFADLPAGDYVVSLDATTLPIGLAPSSGDR